MRAAACASSALALAAAAAAPALYPSRVPLAPLLAKLQAGAGSVDRVLHPRSAADLSALATGKRYKFVVLEGGGLAIAPLPADAPRNFYVHPVLALGAPVRTAGGLRVEHGAGGLRVTVDEDSEAYCPGFSSLSAAVEALVRLGVPGDAVVRLDRPPRCSPAAREKM